VLDVAFPNQILDVLGHVFDRDVRIDPMLIEEIDAIRLNRLSDASPPTLT
jgi:hypothetical protein